MRDAAQSLVAKCFHHSLAVFRLREAELGALDAPAGDGDHGTTMVRGLAAAVAAVDAAVAAEGARYAEGELLVTAGDAFADAAGGAAGALFGALFCTVGRKLAAAEIDPGASPASVSAALQAGLAAVAKLGKAAPGDKTMLDALAPFVGKFAAAVEKGGGVAAAWHAALPTAAAGAAATGDMVAKRGRAARLGERSRGHVDPGAQSVVYLAGAVDAVLQVYCS